MSTRIAIATRATRAGTRHRARPRRRARVAIARRVVARATTTNDADDDDDASDDANDALKRVAATTRGNEATGGVHGRGGDVHDAQIRAQGRPGVVGGADVRRAERTAQDETRDARGDREHRGRAEGGFEDGRTAERSDVRGVHAGGGGSACESSTCARRNCARARFQEAEAYAYDTESAGREIVWSFGGKLGPPLCRGLEEGVAGMRQGGRRVVRVPARLAFGSDGADFPRGGKIDPDRDVEFDVTLTRVSVPPS